MNERKLIKVKITDIDEHNLLDCSIDDAIMHLESIQRLYMGQGFKELELKTHSYGYDGAFEIYLYPKKQYPSQFHVHHDIHIPLKTLSD